MVSTRAKPMGGTRRGAAETPQTKKLRNTLAQDYSNEMMVTDVTLDWFYNPRSISALLVCIAFIFWTAFYGDIANLSRLHNLRHGILAALFVFFVIGVQVFPSGPFTRPHPVFWRLVFSASVVYLLFLVVLLYQPLEDARYMLTYIDRRLNVPLAEKEYAVDCSFTLKNMMGALWDRYVLSHFIGWMINSLMIRDRKICWVTSIIWEIMEISYTHMLPNFAECWWDQWILDVLLCNGLGIEVGYQLCNFLEVQEYKWSGLFQIPTITGKVKRAIFQFSPANWTKVRWEPTRSLVRYFAALAIIAGINTAQLNAFFLKHLLWMPPENNLNLYRLILFMFITAPSLRQFYLYVDRDDIKRIGMQFWVMVAIVAVEFMCILKWSRGELDLTFPRHIVLLWIGILVAALLFTLMMITRTISNTPASASPATKKQQ